MQQLMHRQSQQLHARWQHASPVTVSAPLGPRHQRCSLLQGARHLPEAFSAPAAASSSIVCSTSRTAQEVRGTVISTRGNSRGALVVQAGRRGGQNDINFEKRGKNYHVRAWQSKIVVPEDRAPLLLALPALALFASATLLGPLVLAVAGVGLAIGAAASAGAIAISFGVAAALLPLAIILGAVSLVFGSVLGGLGFVALNAFSTLATFSVVTWGAFQVFKAARGQAPPAINTSAATTLKRRRGRPRKSGSMDSGDESEDEIIFEVQQDPAIVAEAEAQAAERRRINKELRSFDELLKGRNDLERSERLR